MELIISIGLGVWIALGGIVAYFYYKNDDKREKNR